MLSCPSSPIGRVKGIGLARLVTAFARQSLPIAHRVCHAVPLQLISLPLLSLDEENQQTLLLKHFADES